MKATPSPAPLKDPTVRDLIHVILKHKKKVATFFLATLTLVTAYVLFWPRTYKSEAKLFIRVGRETLTLDPTVTTGQTMMPISSSRESEINSIVEMLYSQAMSERVVDRLGPEVVLAVPEKHAWLQNVKGWFGDIKDHIKGWFDPASEPGSIGPRRLAVKKLLDDVDVWSPKKSTVICVGCKAGSAELAQRIVATWVEEYSSEHLRLHRTAGSLDLFSEQAELVGQQLAEAKRKLSEAKNNRDIVSVESQLKLLDSQKLEIEAEQLHVDRELTGAQAKLVSVKASLAKMDKEILVQREEGHSNEAADLMRSQLYDLEMRERALTAKFKDKYLDVVEVRQQLNDVRRLLDKEKAARTRHSYAINPNWQKLQLSISEESARLAVATSTRDCLAVQHLAVLDNIKDLNRFAVDVERLQQEVDLLERSYEGYAENTEQSRIAAAIQQQGISNVNVVQEATLVPEPASPKAKIAAGLALLIGLSGGIGLALICECFDPRLKSPEDIVEVLDLPVLISAPRSKRQVVRT